MGTFGIWDLRFEISRRPRSGDRRGIALILCFLVLTLLSVVVLQLVYTAQVERSLARNFRDGLENDCAARSGAELALGILAAEWGPFDSPQAEWTRERSGIEAGGATVSFTIADEEGKFNLGLIVDADEARRTWARTVLRRLLEIAREGTEDPEEASAESLMETLVKWGERGEAKEGFKPGGGGLGQEEKERRFLTLQELFFLEGFTETLVYGEKKTAAEEQEALRARAGESGLDLGKARTVEDLAWNLQAKSAETTEKKGPVPLADVLTVWGDGKINLNTAPLAVLRALHPEMTAELAEKLDLKRREIPKPPEGQGTPPPASAPGVTAALPKPGFRSVDEIRQVEGIVDASKAPPLDLHKDIKDRVKVKSFLFRVRVVVKNERLTQRWEAVVKADTGQATATPAPGGTPPAQPTGEGEKKDEGGVVPPPGGQTKQDPAAQAPAVKPKFRILWMSPAD